MSGNHTHEPGYYKSVHARALQCYVPYYSSFMSVAYIKILK